MGDQLRPELAFDEVRAGGLGLRAVLEDAFVVGAGLLEQPLDALLALDLPRLVRRQLLVLDRHAVALGEALDGLGEVAGLELHHELEDVAADPTAEAVVQLLRRLDREARRLLVVERAARHRADALLAHLAGARGDQLDEVGALAHLFDRRAVDPARHA